MWCNNLPGPECSVSTGFVEIKPSALHKKTIHSTIHGVRNQNGKVPQSYFDFAIQNSVIKDEYALGFSHVCTEDVI